MNKMEVNITLCKAVYLRSLKPGFSEVQSLQNVCLKKAGYLHGHEFENRVLQNCVSLLNIQGVLLPTGDEK